MTNDSIQELLLYWFGEDEAPNTKLWFDGSAALDEELRARFGELHTQAINGALNHWLGTKDGALALMILFDQLSRNLYRGTAQMFAYDTQALAAARVLLQHQLTPAQRAAAYLCLMHMEDVAIAQEATAGFASLWRDPVTRKHRKTYKNMLHSAEKHLRVLSRFGRFPHRNALLGRETTDEESAYLAQDNSRFVRSVQAHAEKRLKLLVLHSFRQSGARLASRTKLLQQSIEDIAELIFIDAPHAYTPDANEKKLLEEDFGDVPDFDKQRSWWNSASPSSPQSGSLPSPLETNGDGRTKSGVRPVQTHYEGWEESLRFLDAKLKETGADGVLGFSQGSAVTGLLAALRASRLKFVICISGFPSRDVSHQMLMRSQTIDLPSLHIYGKKDILMDIPRTLALADCFIGAEVVSHEGGHFFPELWPVSDIRRFLLRFIEAPKAKPKQLTEPSWASAVSANEEDPTKLPSLEEVSALLPSDDESLAALLLEAKGLRRKVSYGPVDDMRAPQRGDLAHRIWLAIFARSPEIVLQAISQDEDWAGLVRLCVCSVGSGLTPPQAVPPSPSSADGEGSGRSDGSERSPFGEVRRGVAARFAVQLRADAESKRVSQAAAAAPRPDSGTDRVTGLGRMIAAALRPDLSSPVVYMDYRRRLSVLGRAAKLARTPRQKKGVKPPTPETSPEVTRPRPVPVIPCSMEELSPLLQHLSQNVAVVTPSKFSRGTVMPDGRLDLCKQVVGPQGIGPLLEALGANSFVDRLLLGNNIVGAGGASRIASFIKQRSSHIKIWYIAGNELDAEAIAPICDALLDAPEVTGLWLKRNPLGPNAGAPLAKLLRANTNIDTLDLVNTGILDEGASSIFDALSENTKLRHLYLSTDGLTAKTAERIGEYLKRIDRLESLYISCNPLGDEGVAAMLEGVTKSKTLKRLGLASCRLTAKAATSLSEALMKNQTLRFLDLGWSRATSAVGEAGNTLGDEGAEQLASLLRENQTIRALDISHNQMTQAGLNAISSALDVNQSVVFLRFPQYGKATNPDSIAKLQGKLARNRSKWGLDEDELERLRVPQSTRDVLSVYRTQPIEM